MTPFIILQAVAEDKVIALQAQLSTEIDAVPEYRLASAIILAWMGRFEEALVELEMVDELGLSISTRNVPDLLRSAIHGVTNLSPFSTQTNTHPTEQAGWFCAGLNQYTLGNTTEAIALLDRGRQVAISKITLHPRWNLRKEQER